ncbi:MAG TPA: GAF domain-containing sensor histidine kinase, partial [Acidimicrobiales bacterium]
PIVFKGVVIGAFYLTDKIDAAVFDPTDEELVGVFAPHAAVLIEYARLYEQSRELSIVDERNRMARELHDALTQTLFGARLAVQTATLALDASAPAKPDPGTALEHLGKAEALIDDAFGELRSLILDLRPPDLEVDRLGGAVRKQLDLLERTSGLSVKLQIDEDAESVDPEIERQVFRILQEAVANVVRHAGAHALAVNLSVRGDDPRLLEIQVHDDGVGFDPKRQAIRSRRLGLTSMSDRALALGGRLTIESAPGSGTTVRAEVPVG